MLFSKEGLKGILRLVMVIGFLVLLIFIVVKIAVVPKTPATADQVWEVLVSQGYEPQDIAEQYIAEYPSADLIQCIAIKKDDIYFEFYTFKSENSAIDIYGQAHSLITRTRNSADKSVWEKNIANYCIYTQKSSGMYSVAIYVGNTAIYAYCDKENSVKINQILDAIDYLN